MNFSWTAWEQAAHCGKKDKKSASKTIFAFFTHCKAWFLAIPEELSASDCNTSDF